MNEKIMKLNNDKTFQDKLQAVNSSGELQEVLDEYELDVNAEEMFALLERARKGELTDEEKAMYQAGEGELSEESLAQVSGGFLAEALTIWVCYWLVRGVIDGYNAEIERQKKKP